LSEGLMRFSLGLHTPTYNLLAPEPKIQMP
jgi:hypothetical protein